MRTRTHLAAALAAAMLVSGMATVGADAEAWRAGSGAESVALPPGAAGARAAARFASAPPRMVERQTGTVKSPRAPAEPRPA